MKRQCQPWQTGTARPWHRSDPPIPSSGLQRLQWIRHCQSERGRGGRGGRKGRGNGSLEYACGRGSTSPPHLIHQQQPRQPIPRGYERAINGFWCSEPRHHQGQQGWCGGVRGKHIGRQRSSGMRRINQLQAQAEIQVRCHKTHRDSSHHGGHHGFRRGGGCRSTDVGTHLQIQGFSAIISEQLLPNESCDSASQN